ncbi:cytochrome P450 9e2-like [Prorops nasuta]|uniref:cytochrome P450 9e2-like n=1 Tax=Prorops nasuta TaxID=863751 RepID=UPI0034CEFE84
MILSMAIAVAVVALAIYYYGYRNMNVFEKAGIPFEKPWPFFGNMGSAILQVEALPYTVQRIYNLSKEAKYVGFYDFTMPVALIKDPELMKSVAVKNFDHFTDHRQFVDESVDPLFGKNLFALQGEVWKDMRNLLTPAFTSSKMKSMYLLMNKCANDFAVCLTKDAEEASGESVIDSKAAFAKYTNDVIASCAFGIGVDTMKDPENDFYTMGRDVTNISGLRTLKFFLARSAPWLVKLLDIKLISERPANFFKNIISNTIRAREEEGITRPDMIQLMIDSRLKGKELSIDEMTSQAFIFFFGGFDTTSTLMSFASFVLATHEDAQARLQAEVDEVLEGSNGKPSYDDINGMEYLNAVIEETLRLYPVAAFTDRYCVKSFQLPPALPGGKPFNIEKGGSIWFSSFSVHRDPRYFTDPDTFDPDRFLGENKKRIEPSTYLPFGLGPRMCIGNRFALLETRVLVFHLLAKCQLEPSEKTSVPMKFSKKELTIRPEGGFWLTLKPRKNPWTSGTKKNKDVR